MLKECLGFPSVRRSLKHASANSAGKWQPDIPKDPGRVESPLPIFTFKCWLLTNMEDKSSNSAPIWFSLFPHLQMFAAFMCIHIPASAFFPRHAHPRTKQHWENSLEHDEQLAARTFYYLNRRAKLVRGCFVPKGDVPVRQDFFHLKHAQALLWATGSSLARWELLILRTGSRKLILVSDCVQ